jgi:hypothetical protein
MVLKTQFFSEPESQSKSVDASLANRSNLPTLFFDLPFVKLSMS